MDELSFLKTDDRIMKNDYDLNEWEEVEANVRRLNYHQLGDLAVALGLDAGAHWSAVADAARRLSWSGFIGMFEAVTGRQFSLSL